MLKKILGGATAVAAVMGGLLFAGPASAAPAPQPARVAVGAGSAALESQRQAMTSAASAADVIYCWQNVSFKRYGVTRYVSVEMNYSGDRKYQLRARSGSVGPWELFTVCRNQLNEATSIRSQSNWNYVAAEQAYGGTLNGMLRARTGEAHLGPWEVFFTDFNPSTNGTRRCGHIKANANGLFVAAEEDYTGASQGMLRARTPGNQIGSWELFCF